MNKSYLCLGSDQKFPERQLRKALRSIHALPATSITQVSNFHWTKAWGLKAQQKFCNVAVEITTRLSPEILLKNCQKIELKQGRIRKKRWGPRTLDIDIILYANRIVHSKNLRIPHPLWKSRDFVLVPMSELILA